MRQSQQQNKVSSFWSYGKKFLTGAVSLTSAWFGYRYLFSVFEAPQFDAPKVELDLSVSSQTARQLLATSTAKIIELSSLDGSNGFKTNGIAVGDRVGDYTNYAGDFNGDGYMDALIGARGANTAGQGYVIFGGPNVASGGNFELSSLNGTNGFIINGAVAGDSCGASISYAGDINKDGYAEIIIGAPRADPNSKGSAGQIYVIYGGINVAPGGTLELNSLGTKGFIMNGIVADDRAGFSVSDVGDFNGDGTDDVMIGAILADPNGGSSGHAMLFMEVVSAQEQL